MEQSYKKLIVWQKADELAFHIYLETKRFPKEETYGITTQMRRAALSIPANIVEGVGWQNRKELKHFSNIALGSFRETEYLLDFSFRLNYLDQETYTKLEDIKKSVGALLWRFYQSL